MDHGVEEGNGPSVRTTAKKRNGVRNKNEVTIYVGVAESSAARVYHKCLQGVAPCACSFSRSSLIDKDLMGIFNCDQTLK